MLFHRKGSPTQVFSYEYYEIFKNMYFEENLGMAASKTYWKRHRGWTGFSRSENLCLNFISGKYNTLALNHEVYNDVYNHQIFSILINFTGKFCYGHRQKSSRIFLRKNFFERFQKIPKGSSAVECNFYKTIRW